MAINEGETILNKYHIIKLLGQGGMARVWLAEELTFAGRLVAIKEPRADLLPADLQDLARRYQQEITICAALEKACVPNIVHAITAEPYEGMLLLVMEYMPGGDLKALLEQHPDGLSIERAVHIALDLCQALEGVHAHKLEIVHRDIKPSNILFDENERAHLADFGIAQIAGNEDLTKLMGGKPAGTSPYIAPEQETGIGYLTPAADLYALGCVLFEMLTGNRYKRFISGTPARSLKKTVPPWLDDILAKALKQDPADRIQTATEMATALRNGLSQLGTLSDSPDNFPSLPRNPWLYNWPWTNDQGVGLLPTVLIIVVVVAIIVIGLYLMAGAP